MTDSLTLFVVLKRLIGSNEDLSAAPNDTVFLLPFVVAAVLLGIAVIWANWWSPEISYNVPDFIEALGRSRMKKARLTVSYTRRITQIANPWIPASDAATGREWIVRIVARQKGFRPHVLKLMAIKYGHAKEDERNGSGYSYSMICTFLKAEMALEALKYALPFMVQCDWKAPEDLLAQAERQGIYSSVITLEPEDGRLLNYGNLTTERSGC
jgi:hypothetical protein